MPQNAVKNGQITIEATISMGHRLPTYQGICSSPHGHNVRVVVCLAPGDHFIDFKTASDRLKIVLEPMDHAMVLQYDDPFAKVMEDFNFRHVLLNVEPTTENLAQYIFNEMRGHGYRVREVTVHETDKYSATATTMSDSPDVIKRLG